MKPSLLAPFAWLRRGMLRTSDAINRHPIILLGVMCAWFLEQFVIRAQAKPMWHDEVYTALTAQLPLLKLWHAYLDGVDLAPPLNTLLTHVVQVVTGPGEVATRLPAMVGFLAGAVLLFLTVSRRTNAFAGMLGVLLLCNTPAWDYAVEARGYGLSVGLFALALYSWTEAAAGR